MPVWWVSDFPELLGGHERLAISPPSGKVSFYLRYKQREDTAGYNTDVGNVGKNWSISLVSYVQTKVPMAAAIVLLKSSWQPACRRWLPMGLTSITTPA